MEESKKIDLDIKESFPKVNEKAESEDQMNHCLFMGGNDSEKPAECQNYLGFLAGRVRTALTRKGEIKMATDVSASPPPGLLNSSKWHFRGQPPPSYPTSKTGARKQSGSPAVVVR